MTHEDYVFSSPDWLNERRSIQHTIYAEHDWVREYVERILSMKEIPEYKCKASANWDTTRGLVHYFEAQLGEDIPHKVRTKFQKRVSEFINNEIQMIVHGYQEEE